MGLPRSAPVPPPRLSPSPGVLSREFWAVFLPAGKNFTNGPPFFLPVGNPEWRVSDFQLPWRLSPRPAPRESEDVRVAWGTTLTCNTSETLGRAIQNQGVFDLVVSEAICRLLRVGGTAIDVGAYVGHMTGLMAKQAGPNGRVISFEPSPRIRTTLSRNVARWANDRRFAPISIVASSASDRNGRIPSTTLRVLSIK